MTDPDHIITDMVYYWPMYTDIDKKMNASLMIFSRYVHVPVHVHVGLHLIFV